MKRKHSIGLAVLVAVYSAGLTGCGSSNGTTGQPLPSPAEQARAVQSAPNVSEQQKARTLAEMERQRAQATAMQQAAQGQKPQ
jgi:hypothetical protein